MSNEYLDLKWGTIKAWNIETPEAQALLEKYQSLGVSPGAMTQHDTPEQTEILCQMIDAMDIETIYIRADEGRNVTKEEAKLYLREYPKPE